MVLSREDMDIISKQFGDAFYIVDVNQFILNFHELQAAMRHYYKNTHISYSYKTNYIPRLCKIVNDLGGYAEVVSDMEGDVALNIGVDPSKIIFNGPYKNEKAMLSLLEKGSIINMDSAYDFNIIKKYVFEHPDKIYGIGVRCNFDVGDGVLSRFGFDVDGEELASVLEELKQIPNLYIKGLHCHFAARNLEYWENRITGMLNLIDRFCVTPPEYISVGGGLFGKMDDALKEQFSTYIPTYEEYAKVIAGGFEERYKDIPLNERPKLFIEPGSALVGDVMYFVSKIESIKSVRQKKIATLLGSVYNINPTLNGKNPPIEIVYMEEAGQQEFDDLDMGGYTCIESDYLYKGYKGKCAVGDYVVFKNIGSYSIVLKPPFILPNFPILERKKDEWILLKRQEKFEDIFRTYI